MSRKKAIKVVRKLPRTRTGEKFDKYGFQELKIDAIRYGMDYKNAILNKLITTLFHYRVAGKRRRESSEIHIYWIYPDFIVFNGNKEVIEKAVPHFINSLERLGIALTFDWIDFEWYYLLKIFETCQKMRTWREGRLVRVDNPPVIAQGVTIIYIADVATEWEKESLQAKIVTAKGAQDCTQDLSTNITILQGRYLKSLVAQFEMEEQRQEVRLSKGGTMFIRRSHSTKVEKTPQNEVARLLWGLEFAQRLYQSHLEWSQLPLEEKLPHVDVYHRMHEIVVKQIKPIIDDSLDLRLKDIEVLREDLKRKEDNMILESEGLAKEV